jgi:FkbM family methyltransferase
MNLNLKGKARYIKGIIKNYPKWYLVFLSRLLNKPLEKIQLANGLTLIAGEKSLIPDLVDEIFIKEVYNPDFLRIKKGDTVVDVGANIGLYSLYVARMGAKEVYSVEPLAQNIKAIRKNFKVNKIKPPKLIKKALTNKKGKARFYLGDIDSHGTTAKKGRKGKTGSFVSVKTDTLEGIISQNKISSIDFLKIDCEGGEGAIISSLNASVTKKIGKISIEYHNHLSEVSHTALAEKLRRLGFKVKVIPSDLKYGYIYGKRQ